MAESDARHVPASSDPGDPPPDAPAAADPPDRPAPSSTATSAGAASDATRRPPGRRLRRIGAGLVVSVLLAGVVADTFDLGTRWFGWDYPSPVEQPAEVAPPPGLEIPESPELEPVAAPVGAEAVDPDAVRRALADLLDDDRLGRRVGVVVAELDPVEAEGEAAFRSGPARVLPASTLKLLTATAALAELGPDHRFTTSVVAEEGLREVVLVGGGDPLLAREPATDEYPQRADLETLGRAAATALQQAGRTRVRIGYDASLFSGPPAAESWEPSYLPDDVVTPISALWVDRGVEADGFGRSDDPALDAAAAFADVLRDNGIAVRGRPQPRDTDATDDSTGTATDAPTGGADESPTGADAGLDPTEEPTAESTEEPSGDPADQASEESPDELLELAAVESAPLAQVAAHVLEVSDNEGAEVLGHHVALAAGQPATFDGATTAVVDTLVDLGIDTSGDDIYDGSGLSRANRVSPETLLAVLRTAAEEDRPELRAVLTGLPVAGFTGSLTARFDTGAPLGQGAVRAKTGTLTGVHGLAGTVATRDGVVLAFVAVADRVAVPDTLAARSLLDRMASALAACRCAG